MGFNERTRNQAKYKSAHRCCVCHKPFVEIHHLVPQAEGGADSLENAAPLCASCHDLYGGNPEKRKTLRQMRDYWWDLMEERRRHVTEASGIDDSIEILENLNSKGSLRNNAVLIYHVILPEEDFQIAANHLFSLIKSAQTREPNRRRCLFLDIEGHRSKEGGFDDDMFELQAHFLLGFMFRWLSELHLPLIHVRNDKAQANDLPDALEFIEHFGEDSIDEAIEKGVSAIWFARKEKFLRLE